MPELLIVRHAIAEDRVEFAKTGWSDDRRPLTKRGRNRMCQGALGLRWILGSLDLIATSPYVRAAETAGLLAAAFDGLVPEEVEALAPDGPYEALAEWVRGQDREARIALVGHEPHLSGFASLLLGGKGSLLELKKGSACLLNVAPSVSPGSAHLCWALAPAHLRRLGNAG